LHRSRFARKGELLAEEEQLLDIGLPKLNGYEAARRIREQPWGKSTTLVALIGWGRTKTGKSPEMLGSTVIWSSANTPKIGRFVLLSACPKDS